MAKFYGVIGYGESVEAPPGSGVWMDEIVEHPYFGDVIRNTRKLDPGENLNTDISVGNSISIIADQYAVEHFFAIRYIQWAGALWTVTDVEVQSPRLLLTLGSIYNGPSLQSGHGPERKTTVIDNGDGTWSAVGSGNRITQSDNNTVFEIDEANASYLDENTYNISSDTGSGGV